MDGETDGQTAGRERAGSVQALLKRERGSARTKHRRRFISCQRWAGKGDPSGRACVLPPLRTPALGPPLPDPPPTRDPGGCSPPPSPVPQLGKGPYHPASPPPPPKSIRTGRGGLGPCPCLSHSPSQHDWAGGGGPTPCVCVPCKSEGCPRGGAAEGDPQIFPRLGATRSLAWLRGVYGVGETPDLGQGGSVDLGGVGVSVLVLTRLARL